MAELEDDGGESELRKTQSSEPQQPADRALWDFYIADLERPFGPKAAYQALATVFLNVGIRALGKEEFIADLRKAIDWLEKTTTTRPPN